MTIPNIAVTGSFKISGSNITLVYDRLNNAADPAPLSQSFYVSSSATTFYIKAVPTTVPTNPNVKFFVKTETTKEPITPSNPLILNPISPAGVATQREIIFEFSNAKLLPTTTNQHIFDVIFNLTAGESRTGATNPTNPTNPLPTLPSIVVFSPMSSTTSTKSSGCAPINAQVVWQVTTQNINVGNYKLKILDNVSNVVAEYDYGDAANVTVSTSTTYEDRSTGDSFSRTPEFTLQVIRKSDSQVIEQKTTRVGQILTGTECSG